MARLKTDVPDFPDGSRVSEKVELLREYLLQQRQELEFVLSNLSGLNFNGTGLTMDVSDGSGKVLGSLGYTNGGIGIRTGEARIEVNADGAALWFGTVGLRVSNSGIQWTTDGRNWRGEEAGDETDKT